MKKWLIVLVRDIAVAALPIVLRRVVDIVEPRRDVQGELPLGVDPADRHSAS